jgi:AcrR family transcriptional regulator
MDTTKKRGTYRTGRERIERILDAAHELFIVEGYRATSLRDIARASGISHPALLRHFTSKGAILTALIERLDVRSGAVWDRIRLSGGGELSAAAIARANQEVPGWIELFTALLGEATSPQHPGHELMLARRRAGARLAVDELDRLGAGPEQAEHELRALVAGWEGLQILSLYFPGEIDIVDELARHEFRLGDGAGDTRQGSRPTRTIPSAEERNDPIAAAARLYARHGYYETSMQAVADAAGITRAALIHIAPTKKALLDLVLADLFDAGVGAPAWRPEQPRWMTAAEVVLMCGATVPTHPAHDFMTARLAAARASMAGSLGDARVPDTSFEADWLIGVGLGALVGWLYEPELVDPGTLWEREYGRTLALRDGSGAPRGRSRSATDPAAGR